MGHNFFGVVVFEQIVSCKLDCRFAMNTGRDLYV